MFNLLASFVMGVFFVWFISISQSLTRSSNHQASSSKSKVEDEDLMFALNERQLDSLLINAIEGRLGEVEVDDELKGVLADDFIMIAISYGDGRVRQATKQQY